MLREDSRNSGEGYCIQILAINGNAQEELASKSFYIENISRGGFRFHSAIDFEVETRMMVMLRFPDGRTQEVYGRICYCDTDVEGDSKAYGFSVLDGFYTLFPKKEAGEN